MTTRSIYKDNPNAVLLMDDELHNLEFLTEYIVSRKFKVRTCTNLQSALTVLDVDRFRMCIFDLGVPLSEPVSDIVALEGELYIQYPGLYGAFRARNSGHRSDQVVVYSVHDVVAIAEEAARIGVTYITKGRPKILKEEIDRILAFDPSKRRARKSGRK